MFWTQIDKRTMKNLKSKKIITFEIGCIIISTENFYKDINNKIIKYVHMYNLYIIFLKYLKK